MKEIWADIKGYEGRYQVSNLGKIKSLIRGFGTKEKSMSPYKSGAGYLSIGLCRDGKRKHKSIHRLVAQTFIINPKNKSEVNHKDGNKQNNRVDNLEWCTKKENEKHATKNMLKSMGEKHCGSKLTVKQVLEIREKYIPQEYSSVRLAKEYGVCQANISKIINKKS